MSLPHYTKQDPLVLVMCSVSLTVHVVYIYTCNIIKEMFQYTFIASETMSMCILPASFFYKSYGNHDA